MKILRSLLVFMAVLMGLAPQASAYLDPETGTFITRDPSGFADGPNLYRYCQNNPWSMFDPDGLEAVALIRSKEDYDNAISLQQKGDALWRPDVHIIHTPDEEGFAHPAFSGQINAFEYNGKIYNQGHPFFGTRATWFFGDPLHSKIVNDWFASGRTLSLLTVGASTAVGARIPGPASVAEVATAQIVVRGTAEAVVARGGQVAYGGNDLSHMAIAMRYAEGYYKGANAAVVEYRATDGTLKYFSTFSQRGVGHAERLLAKELEAQGIKPEMVTRFYTELEPCTMPGGYCRDFLARMFPDAEVSWTFEYGATKASREAGVEALKKAAEGLKTNPPPPAPGMHQ